MQADSDPRPGGCRADLDKSVSRPVYVEQSAQHGELLAGQYAGDDDREAMRVVVVPLARAAEGGAGSAAEAAEAMRITAQDQQALGVVDRIVSEPTGGAHRDPELAIRTLKEAIIEELSGCAPLGPDELLKQRRAKYLAMA